MCLGKGRRLDTLELVDFQRYRNPLPKTWGPTTINNHLRLAQVLFIYANDTGVTDRLMIRYQIGLKGRAEGCGAKALGNPGGEGILSEESSNVRRIGCGE